MHLRLRQHPKEFVSFKSAWRTNTSVAIEIFARLYYEMDIIIIKFMVMVSKGLLTVLTKLPTITANRPIPTFKRNIKSNTSKNTKAYPTQTPTITPIEKCY